VDRNPNYAEGFPSRAEGKPNIPANIPEGNPNISEGLPMTCAESKSARLSGASRKYRLHDPSIRKSAGGFRAIRRARVFRT
jgi:hypothetical protein